MAIPEGVETVTVSSGEPMTLPDGTLIRGHIRFVAPDLNLIDDEDFIFGGESPAELCHGEFSITLVAPDATGITPSGWTYVAIGEFENAPGWTRYIDITKANPNVFLDDVIVLTPGDIVFPDTTFVRRTGDTMLGALTLSGAPTQDLHAATKKYVDDSFDPDQFVAVGGDTMTGPLILSGDPIAALGAATKQYVDQAEADAVTAATTAAAAESVSLSGDTMTGPLILSGAPANVNGAATKGYVDAGDDARVAVAGDTMTGELVLFGNPTVALGAAPKQYVDAGDAATLAAAAAESVSISGDTMTGPLVLNADPSAALGAATKQYVDQAQADAEAAAAAESVSLTGDTMTGQLVLFGNPTVALGAAPRQYVDAGDAATLAAAAAESVSISGDTMTGALILNADPVNALGAATKQFAEAEADAAQAAAAAESVSLSGDTMTGLLILSGAPVAANGAATKQYADDVAAAAQAAAEATAAAESVSLNGDTMTGLLILSGVPVVANGAATKGYVDGLDAQNVKLTGAQTIAGVKTFSSIPVLPGTDPTTANEAVRKAYVDTLDAQNVKLTGAQTIAGVKTFSSIPVLPASSPTTANEATRKQYVDDGDDARVAVAGDTMTGFLTLNADPTSALHATTKQYTDAQDAAVQAAAAAESVSITGDTMTGALVLYGNPAADLQAAPKQYVDDTINSEILEQVGLDTGIITGGEVNVNAFDNTQVDIGPTTGLIVDYVTTPTTPVVTKITFGPTTATITDLVSPITWLLVNNVGTLIQQTTRPTNAQRRTHLVLGGVLIAGGVIIADQSLPNYPPQAMNQLYDLMDAIGAFNVAGNVVSAASTNLTLAKTAGTVFARSFNHFAGSTLTNDPHISSTASQNPVSMRYVTQVSASPVAPVTSVDPTMYDVGGTITAVPGGANVSTIQRVYIVPLNTVAQQVVIQYGQTTYASLDAAISAVGSETFVKNPNLDETAVLLAYVVAKKSCTNLSVTTDARIINAARFSGNAAGTSDSLSLALLKSGGTMTGSLVLAADPTAALEAATKQYVDGLDAANVKLTGAQTIAGVKTFSSIPVGPASDPTTGNQLTRKTYVDNLDAANVKLTGAQTVAGVKTFSSIPVLPASDPTTANEATRKSYVDTLDAQNVKLTTAQTISGVKTFSSNLKLEAGVNGVASSSLVTPESFDSYQRTHRGREGWGDGTATRDTFLERTASGVLLVTSQIRVSGSAPSNAADLTRKDYVDGLDAANVKLTGDQTVAGIKTFSSIPVLPASDPTTANQATRKSYVDTLDAANVKLTGDQTVAGIKTFSSIPVLPASDPTTANQATRKSYVDTLDAQNVKLTGSQSISGTKTFSTGIVLSAGVNSTRSAVKAGATSRNTTVTPAADPDLVVAVEANARYDVTCIIGWTNGGGGMRVDFTGPTSATMLFVDNDGSVAATIGTDLTFNVTVGCTLKGTLITAGTSGNLTLRWAQNTSNAADTTLLAGCGLHVERVA